MRKWIIVSVILTFLVVIVVLGLWNLNSLINRNKGYFLDQAQSALGRKVSVGEVGVTLWNGIGLRLNNFALSDDASFSSGDFVRAEDLQINVKLLPLLRKELQIKRVILHDPVIGIIRNQKGEYNFSSIGKPEKEKEKLPEKEAPEPSRKVPLLLLVSLVDISGGEVRYLDRQERIDLSVKQIDLRVKDLDFGRPFAVELSAALFSEKQNLKAQTRVGPLRPEAEVGEVPVEGEINIDPVDIDKLKSAVPKITAALPKDLALSGIFRAKELRFQGTLKKIALNGSVDGTDGAIAFGKTFGKAPGVPLVVSADAQVADGAVSLRQAKVKLHTLEIAAKGEAKLGDVAALNLSLDSNRFSLDGWQKIVPLVQDYGLSGNLEITMRLQGKVGKGATPRIQGALTLAAVSAKPPQLPKAITDLNAKISFTGQRADLKEVTLTLGNSRIRLDAGVERFSPLTLSYKLSIPELLPADFQPSVSEDRKADVIRDLTSVGQLIAKDGTVAFQGGLSSGQGSLFKIGYKDFVASLVLENKTARVRNLRMAALQGSVQGEGEYSFGGPAPRFSAAGKVQGLDLKELYRSVDPKGSTDIRGGLNAEIKVSGRGKSWDEIKTALQGEGEAEVLQGALLNFNLAEGALSGITGVAGLTSLINPQVRQKYPETFEAKDTEFKELRALVSLGDGRMNVKNLRITAADYMVQGDGWVDFDRRVDFRSVLFFSQRLSADLGRSAREVRYLFNDQNQFEIPIALTGTLPKVRPRPDSRYLAKMIQRGVVRKGTEELQRRLFGTREPKPGAEPESSEKKSPDRPSTEEMIRRGLEGLFGR
jgi:uncharacterized protein involved in outer membrane biogenesis